MFQTLITPAELKSHLADPDWVVVDCRFDLSDPQAGRRAYAEGHIPGARYAHLDEDLSGPVVPGQTGRHPLPNEADLAGLFSGWGIDDKLQVVVYDDKGGAIAARLWWLLRWQGHRAVAVLEGGWPAWTAGGLPVSREAARNRPRNFVPRPRPELLVDADRVEAIRRDPAFLLVDSRAPERYRGEEEPIDPVAGHIPGAVNRPFVCNFAAEGHLKEPEVLRARFRDLLQDKDPGQTIFYCGSGVTACHNLLALAHAGLGEARLYAGSWSEWIANGERAVETK